MKYSVRESLGHRKWILFGTGNGALRLTDLLKTKLDLEVHAYLDNNPAKWGTWFCGREVRDPKELANTDLDSVLVIIASSFDAEIAMQLNSMGLRKHVHFWSAQTLISFPFFPLTPEDGACIRTEYLRLYGKLNTLLNAGFRGLAECMAERYAQWVPHDPRSSFLFPYIHARFGEGIKARDLLATIAASDHPWRETADQLARACGENANPTVLFEELDPLIGFDEPRHQQLLWITGLLEAHGIRCWTDSGTLLGLMRVNRILRHDHDIDLASWHEQLPEYIALEDVLIKAGYTLFKEKYRGEVFKYGIRPIHTDKPELPININLFRIAKGHAWCPFKVRRTGSAVRPFASSDRNNVLDLDTGPLANEYDMMTWWVPDEYFRSFCNHPVMSVQIPQAWDSYLSLKYGMWREPNIEWNTLRHDGCLNPNRPENIPVS